MDLFKTQCIYEKYNISIFETLTPELDSWLSVLVTNCVLRQSFRMKML